jgi:hypothetical protein
MNKKQKTTMLGAAFYALYDTTAGNFGFRGLIG